MMLELREAALAVNGHLNGAGSEVFLRVSTDSRDIQPGDLFVALKGDRFDGHTFIARALELGAVAVLASEAGPGCRIVVDDTLQALGRLAAFWRQRFATTPVVAVTGSNGKTTVKEMIASVLAERAGADQVLATRGNLNNHIGLPLTLLSLRAEHRFAVVEMGMNHFGEIAVLTQIGQPDVAVITNAGQAHLEALGSIEGVARAKGEIFGGLKPQGAAIINADDPHAALWSELAGDHRQRTFGQAETAQVRASQVELQASGSRFVLTLPTGDYPVELAVPGAHNVRNALAAAAVALELGLSAQLIVQGLQNYHGVKGRLERKTAANGACLIDDTYNANPDSMRAAIDVLAQASGETVLVLGDMGEVGTDAPQLHAEIGRYAQQKGIGRLYGFGTQMQQATAVFGGQHFAELPQLLAALHKELPPQATVLVKGSRFMQMERIVKALQESA